MTLSRRKFLAGAGLAAGAAAAGYLGWKSYGSKLDIARRGKTVKLYDRVLVLGIDGLDPHLLQMLMEEGDAPNFARLWQEGVGGPLRTVHPAQSPVVWSSMASGSNPGKHGVFDFIHRDPGRPLPELSICRTGGVLSKKHIRPRQNCAFWTELSDAGVPVSVVRWPVTFPAEQISGRMFSGLGVPGIRGTLGHYTLYTDRPGSAPDVGAERLQALQMEDGTASTVVTGPQVKGLTGTSESTIPMTVGREGKGVRIRVAGLDIQLAPRQWSDWCRMKFSAGTLKTVTGMAKFFLVEARPDIKLYMTPLEPDPTRPAYKISSPADYAAELAAAIGDYHTLGMPEDTKALNENAIDDEAFLQQCAEITRERKAMFWHEFGRFEEGALALVFDTSDRIQHMFWSANKTDERNQVVQICPPIREHYLQMDRLVGEVLDALDPRTALLLVSDHGFTNFGTCFDLNAWLVEEGLMKLTADPAGMEEDETALYRLVDWSQTVAYGCGFSSLYFNMQGREGNGIVEPSQRAELAADIAERITAYRDPETGQQPIAHIDRREDIYSGDQLQNAPDMVIGSNPGYRMGWRTPIGGVASTVLSPNQRHWDGDHIFAPANVPGTILSNTPLKVEGASVLNVAPTVLSLLGLPPGEDMDGAPLEHAEVEESSR